MKPLKPPIVHKLEARRAKPGRDDSLDLMFWGVVAMAVGLAYCIVTWGGRDAG